MPDADALANIVAMGIPEKQAKKALKETSNNVERAIDWVFSHPDDMGDEEPQVQKIVIHAKKPHKKEIAIGES